MPPRARQPRCDDSVLTRARARVRWLAAAQESGAAEAPAAASAPPQPLAHAWLAARATQLHVTVANASTLLPGNSVLVSAQAHDSFLALKVRPCVCLSVRCTAC